MDSVMAAEDKVVHFIYLLSSKLLENFWVFEESSVTLNKALNKYDNSLLAEDLNINTLRPTSNSSSHFRVEIFLTWFCTGSNPACGKSEICDGENLWPWS